MTQRGQQGCYNCGKLGHRQANCPDNKDNKGAPRKGEVRTLVLVEDKEIAITESGNDKEPRLESVRPVLEQVFTLLENEPEVDNDSSAGTGLVTMVTADEAEEFPAEDSVVATEGKILYARKIMSGGYDPFAFAVEEYRLEEGINTDVIADSVESRDMVFLAKLEPEGSEFRRTVRVCVSDVVDPKFLYLNSSLLDHESEKIAVKQRTVVLQFDYDVGLIVGMLPWMQRTRRVFRFRPRTENNAHFDVLMSRRHLTALGLTVDRGRQRLVPIEENSSNTGEGDDGWWFGQEPSSARAIQAPVR